MTKEEYIRLGAQNRWDAVCIDIRLMHTDFEENRARRPKLIDAPQNRKQCADYMNELSAELSKLQNAFDTFYATPSSNSK